MQGSPDRAPALAVAPAEPPAPSSEVLAEVAAWFRQHSDDQPPLGDRVIQFTVPGRTHAEKMTGLWAFARFLDVKPEFRNEVWFVQRRFGTPGCSVTVDAHYIPDHDEAFRALQDLAAAGRETAGAA